VAGASQNYLYSGSSENHEIKLSRTLYRDSINKTGLFLRGYLNQSANFIDDTEVEVQRRRMAGWEGGVQHRVFLGEAVLNLDLAYRRGTGAFNALRAPEDAFGEGTARPRLMTVDLSFDTPFKLAGQNFRYSGLWRAQWNRTPIVPQDRFSIGGRYTVRGFDGESVLMAERGWLIRNDFSVSLPERQEIYLGLDHGQVGGHSAALLVGKHLTGAALGLRGSFKNLFWDVFAGQPLDKPEGFKTARHTGGFNLAWNW
jgi:hemolysin activation/secretion protein